MPQDLEQIEQQCDFDNIDEMVEEQQPRISRVHDNGMSAANN